jgi:hypothetical protein
MTVETSPPLLLMANLREAKSVAKSSTAISGPQLIAVASYSSHPEANHTVTSENLRGRESDRVASSDLLSES